MALKACRSEKPNKKSGELIPTPEGTEPDWSTKIAIAKKLAEAAKEIRKRKPMSAKTHRWGPY